MKPVRVLAISGSPSEQSRTAAALVTLVDRLTDRHGFLVQVIAVRELPPRALVHADLGDPEIAAVIGAACAADGVVVATPIYQAAYSGLLKILLDLLPKRALAGKVVLPLATAGSAAHLLAIDYALRPVLSVLGAERILAGRLLLTGLDPDRPRDQRDAQDRRTLHAAADAFAEALSEHGPEALSEHDPEAWSEHDPEALPEHRPEAWSEHGPDAAGHDGYDGVAVQVRTPAAPCR